MRLYDLEKGSKILADLSDGSSYVIFDHLDGMYSYCVTEKGGVLHLSGATPLKKEGDYYLIDGTSV